MRAEFSEFTYGFAVVSELARALNCSVAPVFPSLVSEGRAGGGYDVRLDSAGIPIFLQFKLSDYLRTRGAKEAQHYTQPIAVPYYRFQITSAARSEHHALLLGLAQSFDDVFYAAPKFWTSNQLNRVWLQSNIVPSSLFVSPTAIGPFLDGGSHAVCFNAHSVTNQTCFVYSDPQKVPLSNLTDLRHSLHSRLDAEEVSVRHQIDKWQYKFNQAQRSADIMIAEIASRLSTDAIGSVFDLPQFEVQSRLVLEDDLVARSTPQAEDRPPIDPDFRRLVDLGTRATTAFGSQMFMVQSNSS